MCQTDSKNISLSHRDLWENFGNELEMGLAITIHEPAGNTKHQPGDIIWLRYDRELGVAYHYDVHTVLLRDEERNVTSVSSSKAEATLR